MKMRKFYRDTNGVALVEAAITLPLFLSLTFGIIEVGMILWAQVGLQHGAEMAARCASVSDVAISTGLDPTANPTPCYSLNGNATANASSVKNFAASNSWGLNPAASAFSVSSAAASCPGGNLVTASYPFTAINYIFLITLTAQSCYPTS